MSANQKPLSANAQALVDAIVANPGKALTLAEWAELAGVEPKTGYLRSVSAALGDNLHKGEVEKVVTRKTTVKTYTYIGE